MTGVIWTALGLSGGILFLMMVRSGHFFKTAAATVLQGVVAFFAVNAVGAGFGVHLALNWGHLAVAAVGGVPGVILLLLVHTMLGLQ